MDEEGIDSRLRGNDNLKVQDDKKGKSVFKRFWPTSPRLRGLKWVVLVLMVLVMVADYAVYAGKQHDKKLQEQNQAAKGPQQDTKPAETANPQPSDEVIVANPVDLSQFVAISKFRSCSGHIFGESSAFEGKEVASSLKHYFVFDQNDLNTQNTIPVYAPFDGTIIHAEDNTEQFLIERKPFNGWVFDYTHVYIADGVGQGSEVKAGQLVGYAKTDKGNHSIDLILQANKTSGYSGNYDWVNNYDSIFNHMSDAVLAQFAAKGVTRENTIIPKATRDASPCVCDTVQPNGDQAYCNFVPAPFTDPTNFAQIKGGK